MCSVFPNIWCHDLDRGALPALTLLSRPPPPHTALSLSVSQSPFPSSRIWAALPEPPILENATPSHLTGNFLHPSAPPIAIHLRPIFPQGALSFSESFLHAEPWSLSHFLKILVLRLGLLLSLGTGFPTRDCGPPWWRLSLWVLHISLSLLRTWYSWMPAISLLRSGLHHGSWTIPNSFRLPTGMSPGQPWAPPPNTWS
jgi:hypothetical protein